MGTNVAKVILGVNNLNQNTRISGIPFPRYKSQLHSDITCHHCEQPLAECSLFVEGYGSSTNLR